jgi:aqualysin 1
MSLGGEASDLINSAVSGAIAAGVVFVVSAGNDGGKACSKSPASCSDAITVSAVDTSNNRPYYANYGACVDIFG